MIEKWITRAKNHPAITFVIALVVWLIPLVISIDANRLAWEANEIFQIQAIPQIDAIEIFFGAILSHDNRVGLCRHVLLLSNRGGIGTAVFSLDTKVMVGSHIVDPISQRTGNSQALQYYTRYYADLSEAPQLSETLITSSTIGIQPLYSFLIVPSGETVALVLDTEVISHSSPVGQPPVAPGVSGARTEIVQPDDGISVEYTLHFPDDLAITTRPLGCLALNQ